MYPKSSHIYQRANHNGNLETYITIQFKKLQYILKLQYLYFKKKTCNRWGKDQIKSNGGFYKGGLRWLLPELSQHKHHVSHNVMQIGNEFTASPLK